MSISQKTAQKNSRKSLTQIGLLKEPKEEVISDEEVGPSKKKSKMITRQGGQNKENEQVGTSGNEPKEEVVGGDKKEEPIRDKIRLKEEKPSNSRKNHDHATLLVSGFKTLINDVTEIKDYHWQLQEHIPNFEKETKKEFDRIEKKIDDVIQEFIENTVADRTKMNQIEETVSMIEEKLKSVEEENNSQVKLESAEKSIQKLIEENSQFKGKMEKEHKDFAKNVKSYIKEKISKIGSENENKLKSAENSIQKLAEENLQFRERFLKIEEKMMSEKAEEVKRHLEEKSLKLELAENSIQELTEENRQLEEKLEKIEKENANERELAEINKQQFQKTISKLEKQLESAKKLDNIEILELTKENCQLKEKLLETERNNAQKLETAESSIQYRRDLLSKMESRVELAQTVVKLHNKSNEQKKSESKRQLPEIDRRPLEERVAELFG